MGSDSDESYINLVCRPGVHTQRFDLREMCAEFAMQGGASHAQKDSKLQFINLISYLLPYLAMNWIPIDGDLRSSLPILR